MIPGSALPTFANAWRDSREPGDFLLLGVLLLGFFLGSIGVIHPGDESGSDFAFPFVLDVEEANDGEYHRTDEIDE